MSTGQYQSPYREGFREKRGQLQIMRYKYGDFEIWETIPEVLPDGSVMRKVGEEVELDSGTYKVIDVTDSGALCESTARKVVEYTTDGGKEVKFTATRKGHIRVSTYREQHLRRRASRKRLLRGLKESN
tara:strand:- start:1262 stop:1648 length:387 start_codon:yes stop_codon:yes gene_type:complete